MVAVICRVWYNMGKSGSREVGMRCRRGPAYKWPQYGSIPYVPSGRGGVDQM